MTAPSRLPALHCRMLNQRSRLIQDIFIGGRTSSSKSPITSFLHPTLSNLKQQALSRDEDHEEEQTIRTALSLLGYKVTGKVVLGADLNALARGIVGPSEISDEQIIKAALSVLGEKISGKREDVRDLANRIIDETGDIRDLADRITGDGPSSWNPSNYSSNGPGANLPLPVLTESSSGAQSLDPNPIIQLPEDVGYGTTQTSTHTPVHDPHELLQDDSGYDTIRNSTRTPVHDPDEFDFEPIEELTALTQNALRSEKSQGSSDLAGGFFLEMIDWAMTPPPCLKSLPPPRPLKSMRPFFKCRICRMTIMNMSEMKYCSKHLMTIRSNTGRKHEVRHRRRLSVRFLDAGGRDIGLASCIPGLGLQVTSIGTRSPCILAQYTPI